MWKEWERKGWKATGGERDHREDRVKDLLLGRLLRERERIMPARDRDAWGGMVYRLEKRKERKTQKSRSEGRVGV